jgi:2-phosphoglycerate kinase
MIQDFMIEQAQREGVPVVDTGDFDRAVERAVERVLDAMTASEEGEATGSATPPVAPASAVQA